MISNIINLMISFIFFIIILTSFILFMVFQLTDEKHERAYDVGDFKSNDLVKVYGVEDNIVSFDVKGNTALIKEGEKFIIEGDNKNLVGTVKVTELNGNNVTLLIDLKRTTHSYISFMLVSFFFSVILTITFSVIIQVVI